MLNLPPSLLALTVACPPAAELSGEPALVQELSRVLAQRQLEGPAPEGCVALVVHVARRGQGWLLALGPGATPVLRSAPDGAAAATVIESWARAELWAPLLSPRPAPARRPVSPGLPSPAPPAPPPGPAGPHLTLSLGPALAAGSDGSSWMGFVLDVCLEVAGLCLGARAEYAADLRRGGDAVRLVGDRSAWRGLAMARLPLRARSLWVRPGLGLGYGRVASERDEAGREVHAEGGALLLRAEAGLSGNVAPELGLGLALGFTWAPAASRSLLRPLDGGQTELPGTPPWLVDLTLSFALEGR